MKDRGEILARVRAAMTELFEIDESRVTLDANLYQDLEIDSIDAVDLVDRLRRETGLKIAAEDFKAVRTVNDLVETVHRLISKS
jgi:acyl carrier protein